jgi:hypothetical protein
MGVRGGGPGGKVCAQCAGRGLRCRQRAAPRVRGFPVLRHACYSAACAVGWCGAWGCAGTVHMGVRGMGRGGWGRAQCVGLGEWVRLHAAPHLRVFLVRLHVCYSVVCVAGWCGAWGCVVAVDMGVREVGRGGWVRAQCVGHGVRCRLRAAPRMREFPVLLHATQWCTRWDGVVRGAALGSWSCVGEGSAGVFGGW